MGVFSVAAIFSEFGNGANFALVPHCNAYNNVSTTSLFICFLALHTSKPKPATHLLIYLIFLGSHVWPRRFLRKPGWYYLRTRISIPNSSGESLLDYGRHLPRYQRIGHTYCSPGLVKSGSSFELA